MASITLVHDRTLPGGTCARKAISFQSRRDKLASLEGCCKARRAAMDEASGCLDERDPERSARGPPVEHSLARRARPRVWTTDGHVRGGSDNPTAMQVIPASHVTPDRAVRQQLSPNLLVARADILVRGLKSRLRPTEYFLNSNLSDALSCGRVSAEIQYQDQNGIFTPCVLKLITDAARIQLSPEQFVIRPRPGGKWEAELKPGSAVRSHVLRKLQEPVLARPFLRLQNQ